MNIEEGWRFYSADFSVHASGKDYVKGSVTLVRAPDERDEWHKMTDEDKEDDNGPPLWVHGYGLTIEDAIIDANMTAARSRAIRA